MSYLGGPEESGVALGDGVASFLPLAVWDVAPHVCAGPSHYPEVPHTLIVREFAGEQTWLLIQGTASTGILSGESGRTAPPAASRVGAGATWPGRALLADGVARLATTKLKYGESPTTGRR